MIELLLVDVDRVCERATSIRTVYKSSRPNDLSVYFVLMCCLSQAYEVVAVSHPLYVQAHCSLSQSSLSNH